MKKMICLLLALLLFSGCGEIAPAISSDEQSSVTVMTTDCASILETSSTKKAAELLKTAYSQQELLDSARFTHSQNTTPMMIELNAKLPMECVRTFDNSYSYCVYRVKGGGRIFVFFVDLAADQPEQEPYCYVDRVFFVKKPLEKAAFDTLSSENTLNDVLKIDKGLKAMLEQQGFGFGGWSTLGYDVATYHMVKEGFIKITYSYTPPSISWVEWHTTKSNEEKEDFYKNELKIKNVTFTENGGLFEGDVSNPQPYLGGPKTGKFYFLEDDMDF